MLLDSDDEEGTLQACLEAISQKPTDRYVVGVAALIHLRRKNLRVASKLLDGCELIPKKCDEIYLCRFLLAVKTRRKSAAAAIFQQAPVDPNSARSLWCYLAMCPYAQRVGADMGPAKRFREHIAAPYFDSVKVRYLISIGHLGKAVAVSEQMVNSHPERASNWADYTVALSRSHQKDRLFKTIDKALELFPNSAFLLRTFSYACFPFKGTMAKVTFLACKLLSQIPEDAWGRKAGLFGAIIAKDLLAVPLFLSAAMQLRRTGRLSPQTKKQISTRAERYIVTLQPFQEE